MTVKQRIRAFALALEEQAAEQVVPTAHGVGFLADSTPNVYVANHLVVHEPAAAAVLAEEADAVLDSRHHRRRARRSARPPHSADRRGSPRFFAALVGADVAGCCELRELDGVAQIETVEVLEEFRGRGLGRAVVQAALDEARRSNEVVWLEALADDWPRELYAKLGFDLIDRNDVYTRPQHPLARLRLRTPRLELRLATLAEQRTLYRVAAAGIHDPAHMPFAVAWTDELDEQAFLDHHRGLLAEWQADDWTLNLVAFAGGKPIGSQSISGEHFGEGRIVSTGSWLGKDWQGRGLGTELRAAVLTLAFEGLGAIEARSGAIEGSDASLAVSRKLGYRIVGSHTVAPRGAPVEHHDLELRRDEFRSPVPVEIEGLDPSLFGV